MKHEWRKREKEIYLPKNKPVIIQVPEYKYFTIKGAGKPTCKSSCNVCKRGVFLLSVT